MFDQGFKEGARAFIKHGWIVQKSAAHTATAFLCKNSTP